MSIESAASIATVHDPSPPGLALPHGRLLWWTQIRAILQIELRKTLFGRRSLITYGLAGIPLFFMCVLLVARGPFGGSVFDDLGEARQFFAMFYQTLLLRGIVFFGCAWIFTNLFRGEVLDRSLHYYFLSPVRREVLVLAKYLAGLALTLIVFGAMVVLSFLLLYPPFGLGRAAEDLLRGPGFGQLLTYLGITALACLGYGSVFLIAGVLFKNPILPAVFVLGWEFLHFLLPPALKKASVIHYLKGLIPVPINEGPFAVVTEPPPAIVSVLGLLGFTVVALVVASVVVRRMQIRYSDE